MKTKPLTAAQIDMLAHRLSEIPVAASASAKKAGDPALLARAVRAHWGIENRLHWVLDVVFHDDLMRLRTEEGSKNMTTIKHMAINLIRATPGKDSLKSKRKAAGWDQDYLKTLITQAGN